MKGIILAAGMASRLRPLTNDTPKCLLKVGNRCLLERTIDAMMGNDIRHIVFVTGYLNEKIESFVKEHYPTLTTTFIYNKDYETTNNIYSLYLTRPETEGEEVLLMDSDILCDAKVLTRVITADAPNALATNEHELGEEEIKVIVDDNDLVRELSKTCSIADAIGESVGIEKMSSAYTSALFPEMEQMIEREGLANVFYERAFERLIPQGHVFKSIITTDLFSIELDTVEDFQQAQRLIPAELF